jgi:hypothetical protein
MSGCDGNSCKDGSCGCRPNMTAQKNQLAIEKYKCPVVIEADQLVKFVQAERDLASMTAERDRLREALTEVRVWIVNWDLPFDEDAEWPATKRKVDAALAQKGE